MKFEGKLALVTGGSSGIGLAISKQLAAQGASVWILARDPARLDAACREVSAHRKSPTQKIEILSADVTDGNHIAQVLGNFAQRIGPPDLLINSAGVAKPGLFQEMDLQAFRWMMDVNYFGTLNVTHALVPAMIQRRSGHIVNISSIVGFLGVYGYSAYGSAKFAVRGLSDVLRSELVEHKVHVSVVFPPDTQTPQLDYENQFKPPLLRKLDENSKVMTADDVARSILKGVARRQYIITPGFDSTLFFHLSNLLGNLTYTIMDFMVASARRSLRTTQHDR